MQIKVLLILPRHLAHDQDLPINLEMIEDRVLLYEVGALRYDIVLYYVIVIFYVKAFLYDCAN